MVIAERGNRWWRRVVVMTCIDRTEWVAGPARQLDAMRKGLPCTRGAPLAPLPHSTHLTWKSLPSSYLPSPRLLTALPSSDFTPLIAFEKLKLKLDLPALDPGCLPLAAAGCLFGF